MSSDKKSPDPTLDTVRPLSEEDVDNARRLLATLDAKELNEICDGYTQQIKSLISTVRKSMDPVEDEDDLVELERLSRILGFCAADEIFIRSKDKIWAAREHIINKNADWFLNRDYSKLIKKDQKQTLIETIVRFIREKYVALSEEEQNIYWRKAGELLMFVCRYKQLTDGK